MAKRVSRGESAKRADQKWIDENCLPAQGAWRDSIEELIYRLRVFGGQWALAADKLTVPMQGSEHPSLDDERLKLIRVMAELAHIKNQPKGDLTKEQQQTLRRLLHDAIERSRYRLLQEIPAEEKNETRAIQRAASRLEKPPNATIKRILEACRNKSLKGLAIANKVGRSHDYIRRILPSLVKAGKLYHNGDGYRTCDSHT
jgi:hypothetical protein